jgi:hypothetical protein
MSLSCDLARGPVRLTTLVPTCNGNLVLSDFQEVTVTGSGSYPIIVDSRSISLILDNVTIIASRTWTQPITITNSATNVTFRGSNFLVVGAVGATNPIAFGIESSNVTFAGTRNAFLNVAVAGSTSVGIGSHTSGGCLTFKNGTYEIATDGIGIGSGRPASSSSDSRIDLIRIENGTFLIRSQHSGIGSGAAERGTSSVGTVHVLGGSFTIQASRGAGIGSGFAEGGTSIVEAVVIDGGDFRIATNRGAGIGSGFASTASAARPPSSVGTVTIRGGDIP